MGQNIEMTLRIAQIGALGPPEKAMKTLSQLYNQFQHLTSVRNFLKLLPFQWIQLEA